MKCSSPFCPCSDRTPNEICRLSLKGDPAGRHSCSVNRFLCLSLLFARCVWADESADGAVIHRNIALLNQFPFRSSLFTADSDSRDMPGRLWKGRWLSYRTPSPGQPTVMISHEPWGEATIYFPGVFPLAVVQVVNPRIQSGPIRFVTGEVALVDGNCTYKDGNDVVQITPLLFVMKKEGADWKIASIRALASN